MEKDLSKQEKIFPIPKIDAATTTILKPKKEEEKPIDIKIDPIKADIFQMHQNLYQMRNQ